MKIVADQNIPQITDAFKNLGEVKLLPGREISARHLQDCQCLIVRTVTRVDQALLKDSDVKFVGTATIGTDHIDVEYLLDQGIGFSNAAGSNAEAAAEYVVSGIFALAAKRGFDPFALQVGIVGVGNVGSRLLRILNTIGIECLLCDPPLAARPDCKQEYVELDQIIKRCDLISMHVPLTLTGDHPTLHLLDAHRLGALKHNCILINAARGEIIDNPALSELLKKRRDLCVFLDTWENEPRPLRDLLTQVDLATPHIAGYSVEGRLRAVQMVLDAACDYFSQSSDWHMSRLLPDKTGLDIDYSDKPLEYWSSIFQAHFNIWRDHEALLSGLKLGDDAFGDHFDSLRRVYPDRLEYERFSHPHHSSRSFGKQLQALGFSSADEIVKSTSPPP